MIRVLNYFLECVKILNILFHLNIHRPASNASTTRMNTVYMYCTFDTTDMHSIALHAYVHTIKLFDSVLCTFDTSDMK